MRRALWVAGLLMALTFAIAIFTFSSTKNHPCFVPWPPRAPCPEVAVIKFLPGDDGFDDSRVWLPLHNQYLLYDTDSRRPLGYLTNGYPVAFWSNQVICAQYRAQNNRMITAWWWLRSHSHLIPRPPITANQFWLLNLDRNQAVVLGSTPAGGPLANQSHQYAPSPDQKFGLFKFREFSGTTFLFDIKNRKIKPLESPDQVVGWWDAMRLLYRVNDGSLYLQGIGSSQPSPLAIWSDLRRVLKTNNLPEIIGQLDCFASVCGKEYRFYLSDGATGRKNTFLIELCRPEGHLELRSKILPGKFREESGKVDPTGRYYICNVTSAAYGQLNRGLMAIDLNTGATNILAAADDTKSSCSICIRKGEAYFINGENTLQKTALDGSGKMQVFPSDSAAGK